ncbi:HAMP domain-containing sensor histidine kinase [Undibacterium sp.]|jgi:two-component system OmpR family sensor kinase|uniref:HAMP domain-containing sensor histidine kinase n=1 Tax=Undibacterium sp. TaxID=1914977 RepID=UPI002CD1A952|nr:ATP-binding protein [Undibacterium sp.]HTD06772.1 ATP-binding protein [Undibacterium sp.]
MGRLFWKFFFFILLAQVTAIIGISGTLWLKHSTEDKLIRSTNRQAHIALVVESAEIALQQGGPEALRRLSGNLRRFQVYVIDEHNLDILGRLVSLASIEKVKASIEQGPPSVLMRKVAGPDKQTYLIFFSSMEDAWGRGAPEHHPELAPGDRPPLFEHDGPGPGGPDREPPHGGDPGAMRAPGSYYPLIPVLSALVASLLFAALLAWYMSKPIRNLRSAFIELASGKLDTRIGNTMGRRRDELADLGREFDLMAGKLHVLMESQRQLMHDVSHELRSPLARLQAAIGLARQQPEKMEATLDRLEHESVRMDKLVGELLTLSRIEAGVTGANEEISMADLIAEVVENARFEAEVNHRKLEFSGDTEVIVLGKFELLYRALENVVRNAIKHTAEGSTVTMNARPDRENSSLSISVLDQGGGVPDAELAAIFEPFFRGSQITRAQQGYGLGLTIAKRVLMAHGGVIRASNGATGGLCVEIILPCKFP